MFKATINLNVKAMPPEGLSLNQLKEFFDRQDKYKVADYFTHIQCCQSYCGRKSLKYKLVTENGQDKLIIEFMDKKGFEFFKVIAPQCVFSECDEV